MIMDINLEKNSALLGREYWLTLKRKYSICGDTCVILLVNNDTRINEAVMTEIPVYMKGKYLEHAVVLLTEENPLSSRQLSSEKIKVEKMTKKQMEDLLMYYKLINFYELFVVISTDEPFGNLNMINKHGISIEDYVRGAYI